MDFSWVAPPPVDGVFGVDAAFKESKHPKKVNLSIGAYRDTEGKPVIFRAVKKAGESIYKEAADKEYLPMGGQPAAAALQRDMIFGADCDAVQEGRVASVQTMSGTGALAALGQFLRKFTPTTTQVYLSSPTWANHDAIFTNAGFQTKQYPYWRTATKDIDMEGYLSAVQEAPRRSIFIVHPIAHNPTGCDPTPSQWERLLQAFAEREHFVLLDCAYQGFATGNLKNDSFVIRLFADSYPYNFAVAQSFAKNMGLYGERCGAAHMCCRTAEEAKLVCDLLKRQCRTLWSNPAKHGQEICYRILRDPGLRQEWEDELAEVSGRIMWCRKALRAGLEKRGTPGTWDHITTQVGLFSYLGLSKAQVDHIVKNWHVYMLPSSRISLAGVNPSNVDYICDAIDDAVTKVQS